MIHRIEKNSNMNYYIFRPEFLENYREKTKKVELQERSIQSRSRRYNSEPGQISGSGHRLAGVTFADPITDVSGTSAPDNSTDQTRKKEFYSGVSAQCRPRRYNSEPAERSGSSDQLTDTASGDPSWDESWVFATADDPDQTLKKELYAADGSSHCPYQRSKSESTEGSRSGYQPTETTSSKWSHDTSGAFADGSGQEKFDFYLAVPEADIEDFGIPFCKMVESRMNMRPCLTLRDIGAGYLYENMGEALETKCGGKVVFVVSKNFGACDECQFLVQFAKTLDPDAVSSKLIPLVIDKNVALPRVLEGLSSINYNAAMRENWLGKRLWEAIHGGHQPSPLRSMSCPGP